MSDRGEPTEDIARGDLYETLKASLQCYESSAEDTHLLKNLRSFDVRKQSDSQIKEVFQILADLVDIFNELHKKDIFSKVKSRVALSAWETSKVNCLTLSVSLLSQLTISYDHQPLTNHLMLYLEDLIEAALPNKVAARMSQIFLTSLCNISEIHGVDIGEERRSTMCRCFRCYSNNDLIKIPSAYLLVVTFNSKGPKVQDDGIREFIDYLNAVVARSNSESINGFFMGPTQQDQISRASNKEELLKVNDTMMDEKMDAERVARMDEERAAWMDWEKASQRVMKRTTSMYVARDAKRVARMDAERASEWVVKKDAEKASQRVVKKDAERALQRLVKMNEKMAASMDWERASQRIVKSNTSMYVASDARRVARMDAERASEWVARMDAERASKRVVKMDVERALPMTKAASSPGSTAMKLTGPSEVAEHHVQEAMRGGGGGWRNFRGERPYMMQYRRPYNNYDMPMTPPPPYYCKYDYYRGGPMRGGRGGFGRGGGYPRGGPQQMEMIFSPYDYEFERRRGEGGPGRPRFGGDRGRGWGGGRAREGPKSRESRTRARSSTKVTSVMSD